MLPEPPSGGQEAEDHWAPMTAPAQDTRRLDAIWDLITEHLVELMEARRKLKAVAEVEKELWALHDHDRLTAVTAAWAAGQIHKALDTP